MDKQAFTEIKNEMNKSAALFNKKKAVPADIAEIIAQRDAAILQLQTNAKTLQNPKSPPVPPAAQAQPAKTVAPAQPAAQARPAAQPAKPATPAQPVRQMKDFGDYANESPRTAAPQATPAAPVGSRVAQKANTPKLNKGRVGMAVGGALAAGAAGAALLNRQNPEEEKVAFTALREEMEKIANHYTR